MRVREGRRGEGRYDERTRREHFFRGRGLGYSGAGGQEDERARCACIRPPGLRVREHQFLEHADVRALDSLGSAHRQLWLEQLRRVALQHAERDRADDRRGTVHAFVRRHIHAGLLLLHLQNGLVEVDARVACVRRRSEDALDEGLEAALRRAVGAREVVLPSRPAQAQLLENRAEGHLERAREGRRGARRGRSAQCGGGGEEGAGERGVWGGRERGAVQCCAACGCMCLVETLAEVLRSRGIEETYTDASV